MAWWTSGPFVPVIHKVNVPRVVYAVVRTRRVEVPGVLTGLTVKVVVEPDGEPAADSETLPASTPVSDEPGATAQHQLV